MVELFMSILFCQEILLGIPEKSHVKMLFDLNPL